MASLAAKKVTATRSLHHVPLTAVICPTRRSCKLYPYHPSTPPLPIGAPAACKPATDYAGNGGDYPAGQQSAAG